MSDFLAGTILAIAVVSQGSTSLNIKPLTASVKGGPVVKVRVTVTNNSDGELTYSNVNRDCDYSFTVLAPSGSRAPETAYKQSLKCNSGGLIITGRNIIVTLKPGQSSSEEVRLTDLYDFTASGQYAITASRKLPDVGEVKSNTAFVTVSQ